MGKKKLRFLVLARKLWGKMSLVDLADALNIPVSHARAFALEHQRRQAQAEILKKTGRQPKRGWQWNMNPDCGCISY